MLELDSVGPVSEQVFADALVHGAFGALETMALLWFQLLPDLWAFSAHSCRPLVEPRTKSSITISFLLFTTVLTSVKGCLVLLLHVCPRGEKHGFNKQTRALFIV
jgi:hypothetical protein